MFYKWVWLFIENVIVEAVKNFEVCSVFSFIQFLREEAGKVGVGERKGIHEYYFM